MEKKETYDNSERLAEDNFITDAEKTLVFSLDHHYIRKEYEKEYINLIFDKSFEKELYACHSDYMNRRNWREFLISILYRKLYWYELASFIEKKAQEKHTNKKPENGEDNIDWLKMYDAVANFENNPYESYETLTPIHKYTVFLALEGMVTLQYFLLRYMLKDISLAPFNYYQNIEQHILEVEASKEENHKDSCYFEIYSTLINHFEISMGDKYNVDNVSARLSEIRNSVKNITGIELPLNPSDKKTYKERFKFEEILLYLRSPRNSDSHDYDNDDKLRGILSIFKKPCLSTINPTQIMQLNHQQQSVASFYSHIILDMTVERIYDLINLRKQALDTCQKTIVNLNNIALMQKNRHDNPLAHLNDLFKQVLSMRNQIFTDTIINEFSISDRFLMYYYNYYILCFIFSEFQIIAYSLPPAKKFTGIFKDITFKTTGEWYETFNKITPKRLDKLHLINENVYINNIKKYIENNISVISKMVFNKSEKEYISFTQKERIKNGEYCINNIHRVIELAQIFLDVFPINSIFIIACLRILAEIDASQLSFYYHAHKSREFSDKSIITTKLYNSKNIPVSIPVTIIMLKVCNLYYALQYKIPIENITNVQQKYLDLLDQYLSSYDFSINTSIFEILRMFFEEDESASSNDALFIE